MYYLRAIKNVQEKRASVNMHTYFTFHLVPLFVFRSGKVRENVNTFFAIGDQALRLEDVFPL